MCVRLGICLCMFMCIVRTWVCVSPELRLCICLEMFLLVFVLVLFACFFVFFSLLAALPRWGFLVI